MQHPERKPLFDFQGFKSSTHSLDKVEDMRELYIQNYTRLIGQVIFQSYKKKDNPPDIIPSLMIDPIPQRFNHLNLTNLMLKYFKLFDKKEGTITKENFIKNFTFFNNSSSHALIGRIYDVLTRLQNTSKQIHTEEMENQGFMLGMDKMNLNTFLDYFEIINKGSLKSKLLLTFLILDGVDGDGFITKSNFEELVEMMLNMKAFLTGDDMNPNEKREIIRVFIGDVDENQDDQISFAEFYKHYSNRPENEFFDLIYGKGIDINSSNKTNSREHIFVRKLIDINIQLNKCFEISEKIIEPNFKPFQLKMDRGNLDMKNMKSCKNYLAMFTKLKQSVIERAIGKFELIKRRTIEKRDPGKESYKQIDIDGMEEVISMPNPFVKTRDEAINVMHQYHAILIQEFSKAITEAHSLLELDMDSNFDQYKSKQLSKTIRGQNKLKHEKINSKKNKLGSLVRFIDSDSFNLVLGIMLGIDKAIKASGDSGTTVEVLEDYEMEVNTFKYTLPINPGTDESGSQLKPVGCLLEDYGPKIFYKIRKMDNISNKAYLNSIRPISFITALLGGEWRTLAELVSPGKSGSFLYFTFDGNYLLKAIMPKEFVFFKKTLIPYYQHLENNGDSLLARYYGLYKLQMTNKGKTDTYYLVVMNNIFNTPNELHYRFDLKGSSHGREKFFKDAKLPKNEEMPSQERLTNSILKDNDFRFMKIKGMVDIKMKSPQRERILRILKLDSQFLASVQVIDYSLLVGVHVKGSSQEDYENMEEQGHIIESTDQKKIYYFGVIDTFIEYVFKKKMEYNIRSCTQGAGISCIPPKNYSMRFVDFMTKIIE